MVSAVVYGSSVLGALARAMIPYLRARAAAEREGKPPEDFRKTYLFTAILAVVISGVIGVLLFPDLIKNTPDATAAGVFAYGFIAGWGATSLLNQILSTGQQSSLKKESQP
jgi:hypothetical protein